MSPGGDGEEVLSFPGPMVQNDETNSRISNLTTRFIMKSIATEVIIIGGGATGAGTFRDCLLRGIPAALVEKNDLASGTTGRNHGLLHSGARYALKDPASALECIAENRILKRIASHCIEDTGGLFAALADDDPAYGDQLPDACKKVGIKCREISRQKALRFEPNLNPQLIRAFSVPDATIDPFRLVSANVLDARERGGRVFTHTHVDRIQHEAGVVTGVQCRDRLTGEQFELRGKIVVNASGVWSEKVCQTAGVELKMFPSKGSLIIFDYRVNRVVVNACRMPADADILVPGDTVSLIGTTSRKIAYDKIDTIEVDEEEIAVLLAGAERLVPNVSQTRLLRAYCGVRPLISLNREETDGRAISRGIVLVDHAERDGLSGLVSIAGGKLMTYRLMAEQTTDLICRKLNRTTRCETQKIPLPGSEKKSSGAFRRKQFKGLSDSVVSSTHYRHGERVHQILKQDRKNDGLICECEMVTAGEVEYALKHLDVKSIIDLRRRTRLGMGPCQGALCACRATSFFVELKKATAEKSNQMLIEFIEERWKGIKPILWGDALREAEFSYWIHQSLIPVQKPPTEGK